MNYKDIIMSEYIIFQQNKSYCFPILKRDNDRFWLPNLERITTGWVIIFRLLSLVFFTTLPGLLFEI